MRNSKILLTSAIVVVVLILVIFAVVFLGCLSMTSTAKSPI